MTMRTMVSTALAMVSSLAVIAPVAPADPVGPPQFRALAGGGSFTTQGVLNALSDVVTIDGVKQIASYDARRGTEQVVTRDPAVVPGCKYQRWELSGSDQGVGYLQASLEGSYRPGCLDFARTSYNNSSRFPSNPQGGPGRLSYVPFAVDALTYVLREDSPLPNNWSVADLRAIYDCTLPTATVQPMLPASTTGTRFLFLQQLGYSQAEIVNFSSTTHPCVTFTDASGLSILPNQGTVLTDPRQIAPYSVAQYLSQINRVIPDVHGRTVMGLINGSAPAVASAPDALTFVIRDDSPLPNDLSVTDLRAIFDCVLPTTEVKPMMPRVGSAIRTPFLQRLGYTQAEIDNFTPTKHPCVTFTDEAGNPLPENTGTLLTDRLHIAPYSVAQYLSQVDRTIPDVHGRTVMGLIGGQVPAVQNPNAFTQHDVYNVIPSSTEGVVPWNTVFVGSGSLVCQNPATIIRLGFRVAPNCGVITIRTR